MTKKNDAIIITGVTTQGKTFRPSNWADRLCGKLSTVKNHRLRYSPMLIPSTNTKGQRCITMHPKLEQQEPALFRSILQFAKTHHLVILHPSTTSEEKDPHE